MFLRFQMLIVFFWWLENETAGFASEDGMGMGTGVVIACAIHKDFWTGGSHGGNLRERKNQRAAILCWHDALVSQEEPGFYNYLNERWDPPPLGYAACQCMKQLQIHRASSDYKSKLERVVQDQVRSMKTFLLTEVFPSLIFFTNSLIRSTYTGKRRKHWQGGGRCDPC